MAKEEFLKTLTGDISWKHEFVTVNPSPSPLLHRKYVPDDGVFCGVCGQKYERFIHELTQERLI